MKNLKSPLTAKQLPKATDKDGIINVLVFVDFVDYMMAEDAERDALIAKHISREVPLTILNHMTDGATNDSRARIIVSAVPTAA